MKGIRKKTGNDGIDDNPATGSAFTGMDRSGCTWQLIFLKKKC